jgi:streptogramin lyase
VRRFLHLSTACVAAVVGIVGCGGSGVTTFTQSETSTQSGGTPTVAPSSTPAPTVTVFPVGIDPRQLAIDKSGNVWVTDQGDTSACGAAFTSNHDDGCRNNAVFELSPTGATVRTLPNLFGRGALAIDAAGNAWIAHPWSPEFPWPYYVIGPGGSVGHEGGDFHSSGISRSSEGARAFAIGASGNITTVGTPPITCPPTCSPSNNLLYTVSPAGAPGTPVPVPAGTYQAGGPVIDTTGNVWIAPFGTAPNAVINAIAKVSPSGTVVSIGPPSSDGSPSGMAIDRDGNAWVTLSGGGGDLVAKFDKSASQPPQLFQDPNGGPAGLAIDSAGNVWVANTNSGTVVEMNASGTIINKFSPPDAYAVNDVALDASGNVWATMSNGPGGQGAVMKISAAAKGPQFFPYPGPQFPTTGLG